MADKEKQQLPADAFDRLPNGAHLDSEKIAAPSLTFLQDSWRRLKKNRAAMISLLILVILFVLAFGSMIWSPANPNATNPSQANLPPRIPFLEFIPGLDGTLVQSGSRINAYTQAHVADGVNYWLGTDYLGRDLLSRILYGTRISLTIAVIATFFDLTIGVAYGMTAGMKGGAVDTIMQRIIDVMLSIPNLVVMVLLILILKPGMTTIIVVIALTSWINMARLVRAQTMELKNQEFVLAARTLGESQWKIATKHLLPNLTSVIIINTMFTIPSAIFFEAFLSYIGIGISAPKASLGTLINNGQQNFQFLPYQMWGPAIVLILLMIAFNILGDGMRDAFDPKSRK
ncbi:ABC transporter permease [Lactobacillaceae bacterium Melli_B4]